MLGRSDAAGIPRTYAFVPRHLGDAVLCLAALRRLASGLDGELVPVVPGAAARVLAGQGPWRDPVASVGPGTGGAAVLFARSLRVALLAVRAGCAPRVGLAGDGRRPLLTAVVPPAADRLPGRPRLLCRVHQRGEFLHVADAALATLGRPGDRDVDGRLRLDASAAQDGDAAWRALGEPELIVHPVAAGLETKQGSERAWIALLSGLRERGVRVALTGGPARWEARRLQALSAAVGVPAAAGESAIRPLAWAAAALRARAVLAPDTGTAHLAAAAGARVLVAFGPTDSALHVPPGRTSVLELGAGLACAPCYSGRCDRRGAGSCVDGLAEDRCLSWVLQRLEQAA